MARLCPHCQVELTVQGNALSCPDCGKRFALKKAPATHGGAQPRKAALRPPQTPVLKAWWLGGAALGFVILATVGLVFWAWPRGSNNSIENQATTIPAAPVETERRGPLPAAPATAESPVVVAGTPEPPATPSSPPEEGSAPPTPTAPVVDDQELARLDQDCERLLAQASRQLTDRDFSAAAATLQEFGPLLESFMSRVEVRCCELLYATRTTLSRKAPPDWTKLTPEQAEYEQLGANTLDAAVRFAPLSKLTPKDRNFGSLPWDEAQQQIAAESALMEQPWNTLVNGGRELNARRRRIEQSVVGAREVFDHRRIGSDAPEIAVLDKVLTAALQRMQRTRTPKMKWVAGFPFGSPFVNVELGQAGYADNRAILVGSSALSLISGNGDPTARDGISLVLGRTLQDLHHLSLLYCSDGSNAARQISVFPNLKSLSVGNARWSADSGQLAPALSLEWLELSEVEMTAVSLGRLCEFSQPKSLRFHNVRVTGSAAQFRGLKGVTQLTLDGGTGLEPLWAALAEAQGVTNLTADPATLPPESWRQVALLKSLAAVDLRAIDKAEAQPVTETHLSVLEQCTALKRLTIEAPLAPGAGRALARLPQLSELKMTELTDEFELSGLSPRHAWASLTLSGLFPLNDDFLKQIISLENLTSLTLTREKRGEPGKPPVPAEPLKGSGSPVGDAGLEGLKGLKQLEALELRPTAITDKGLASLQRHPALKRIRIESDAITLKGMVALIESLPAVRSRYDRRAILLDWSGEDHRPFVRNSVAGYLERVKDVNYSDATLETVLRSAIQRHGIVLYWMSGTPLNNRITLQGKMSWLEELDAISKAAQVEWETDGQRFYVGPPKAIERISRRIDDQVAILSRAEREASLRWLNKSAPDVDFRDLALNEVARILGEASKSSPGTIVVDPANKSLGDRKITFRLYSGYGTVLSLLDCLAIVHNLDWTIDNNSRIVIRAAK